MLSEAERFGAICANRLLVTGLVRTDDGRGAGVMVLDCEREIEFTVRAANVVNATGVWAARAMALVLGRDEPRVAMEVSGFDDEASAEGIAPDPLPALHALAHVRGLGPLGLSV